MRALTLGHLLEASAKVLDEGREQEVEPALDLKIALEISGAELLSVAGAMEQRLIDDESQVDRRHLARIRKAIAKLNDALAAHDRAIERRGQ